MLPPLIAVGALFFTFHTSIPSLGLVIPAPFMLLLLVVEGTESEDNKMPSHTVSWLSINPVIVLLDKVYAEALLYARLWNIPRRRTAIILFVIN